MHLVEQYALACGVKIDKPFVETNYFPLPFRDYIIIHPSSGMKAKDYDYYRDVIDLIYPYLQKAGIEIVQIGTDKDPTLPRSYTVNQKTSLGQSFYLIKNCMLLLGNDSFSSHVAGGFNKKLVSLYSNLYKECCEPYWGNKEKQLLLQAPRKGLKPSFAAEEENKVVNNIKPEEIARSVLSLLDIQHTLSSYETLHTGPLYQSRAVEIVPNFFNPNLFNKDQGINIRLDYHFDPEIASRWAFNHKSHIIVDKPIDPKYFQPLKDNLLKITVELAEGMDPEYILLLKNLGCEISLCTRDTQNLTSLRLQFIDWSVEELSYPSKKDLDIESQLCNNTHYKSSKLIFSNNKKYSSKSAWANDQEHSSAEKIIDSPEFWEESEYFRIYNT